MNSSEFIAQNIKNFFTDNIFVAPGIPDKKLDNATKAFGVENHKNIVALYDNTLLGSADCGIVFTGTQMIVKASLNAINFPYQDIKVLKSIMNVKPKGIGDKIIGAGLFASSKISDASTKFLKDKVGSNGQYNLNILTKDREFIIENVVRDCDMESLVNFINQLLEHCDIDDFKDEDMLKPIAEMSENLKESYIKIIIFLSKNTKNSEDNTNKLDSDKLAEIFLLMNRLKLEQETRFKVREYIIDSADIDISELLESMRIESGTHYKSIKLSLIKDLILLQSCVKEKVERDNDFINKCAKIFDINESEIEILYEAVENDYKMLKEEFEDDVIKRTIKDFAAKAAGVGVPLGAVYMSGSVLGMSAAGMTSGLATLGMGGVLGLSSMATGIGIAVLIGIGAYQGIKFITKDNALSKYKHRELMLHEIIKSTQNTISQVINDINFVVEKLNNAIKRLNTQGVELAEVKAKVEKLVGKLGQFQAAMNSLNNKNIKTKNLETRLQCPKIISVDRLRELTQEPTKQSLFDFVMQNYEEILINENGKEIKQFKLKDNVDTQILEEIRQILDSIEYFKGINVAKDKIGSSISDLKDKLK